MTDKLTGETRYRPDVRGLIHKRVTLVLQVQEETTQFSPDPYNFYSRTYMRWRDARVEDLLGLELAGPVGTVKEKIVDNG